jgi:hypothetical protein
MFSIVKVQSLLRRKLGVIVTRREKRFFDAAAIDVQRPFRR